MTEAQMEQRRRNAAAIAARRRAQKRCKRGHEFTDDNSIWLNDGRRRCRTCRNDWLWYYRRGLGMAR